MKFPTSFLVLASGLLLAPTFTVARAAPAKPRLVGSVYPLGGGENSVLMLGGAYFPGKGYRTDVQSKWALYPGVRWQLFGLDGAGPNLASERGEISDVPAGYSAQLRGALKGERQMIAVSNAGPEAQPRLPRRQSLNQPLYQRVAAELLRAQGLNVKSAKLTQLMRIDLNGDGIEEVLMTARSRPDYGDTPEERAGDYSLVALRYVDRGVVKAVALNANVSKKNVSFSAPTNHEVIAVVDVDGDGKMEIVGANGYYEGGGFDVWKFDGRGVERVISAGWGV